MQAFIRGQSPERISTAVMGTVLECHDQGFHFLGGMVPGAYDGDPQLYMQAGLPMADWTAESEYNVEVGIGRPVMSPPVPAFSTSNYRMSAESAEEPAVRHLRELMATGRDGKLTYLSDAGMGKSEAASLISLVVGWVDEAGLERLDGLSRVAAERELGPGHILERWINGRCQLRLALLLDDPAVEDSDLAAAYAVSHAADLVLASYRSDLDAEDDVISLVPGDDLD